MEPGLLVVGLIASIGATHLAVKAGKFIHSHMSGRKPTQADQPTDVQIRDDWYVFFHCADLLGRNNPQSTADNSRQSAAKTAPVQQRPSRPRPRL